MDPMNYEMDNSPPRPSPTTRCPYYHQPTIPNLGSPLRDAHHYDPVHNTEAWLSSSQPTTHQQNPYTAAQNFSPARWGPGQFSNRSWNNTNEPSSATTNGPTPHGQRPGLVDYRPQPTTVNPPTLPWAQIDYTPQFPHLATLNNTFGSSSRTPSDTGGGRNATQHLPRLSAANQAISSFSVPSSSQSDYHTINAASYLSAFSSAISDSSNQLREPQAEANGTSVRSSRVPQNAATSRYQRSAYATMPPVPGGWSSGDDDDDSAEPGLDPDNVVRFAEQRDERTIAIFRARALAAGKRVPSREAIASLEKVPIKDLKDEDKMCIICYNDFGVENPEGVTEQPIRLPKCKHIFGDACIKKWFQDSDSCPYCRDKLPSEISFRGCSGFEHSLRAHRANLALAGRGYRSLHGVPPPRAPRWDGSTRYPYGPGDLARFSETSGLPWITPDESHPVTSDTRTTATSNTTSGSTTSETSESRRRQTRVRSNTVRQPSTVNRPSSVGSVLGPHSALSSSTAQRVFGHRASHGHASMPGTRRSNDQTSSQNIPAPPTNLQTPQRPSTRSFTSNSQEPSPVVAVGSGLMSGDQQASQTSGAIQPNTLVPTTTIPYSPGQVDTIMEGQFSTPEQLGVLRHGGQFSFAPPQGQGQNNQPDVQNHEFDAFLTGSLGMGSAISPPSSRGPNFQGYQSGSQQFRWSR